MKYAGENKPDMAQNPSRRDVLKLLGATGAVLVVSQAYTPLAGTASVAAASSIAPLLGYYANDARRNIVIKNRRRAMLSSHIYPKATFVRDSLYGPLALNDVNLGAECYRWFAEAQNPETGQIRCAVPFDPQNEYLFQIWDDDSSLLFVIWSAWLKRSRINVDPAYADKAWSFVKTHVINDFHLTPAQPFCYWADTVQFDTPERVAHNQGLYVVALRSMLEHGWGGVTAADYAQARARYVEFFRPDFGFMTLGKDSWWADKIDISVLFPEFLLRWLYKESALPDEIIRATVDRYVPLATVTRQDKALAGLKVICAADGSFLPPERFSVPSLNDPGHYQNGGYWPMYTLVALALRYKIAPDKDLKALIETLVQTELATDRRSKEIIILAPGVEGAIDPNRSGYTWNSLIGPALKWAGIA
jgi:hypothetical protein